jgi:HAD superfamily hydrolase (TIGR01490 family)
MNRPKLRIAIYDMDKTITRRPTYLLFLLHAARTRERWRLLLLPLAALSVVFYALRLIDRGRLKELNHRLLLGATVPVADARALAESFASATLADNILSAAHTRLHEDATRGSRLVLATASYAFYASVIAQKLGIADTIGTKCHAFDGRLRPRIDGENCYGTAKLRMIEAWLADQGLVRDDCHIRFYSDHVSDLPCLEWADEPFAVNAHAPLAKLARMKGWPVLDWR